jgi:HSP20 family protein
MKNLLPVNVDNFFYPDPIFDNFFNRFLQPIKFSQMTFPKIDVQDTDKAYIVTADLPGVTKENITITYNNDVLAIVAQHNQEKEEQDKDTNYIRKERVSNAFSRQFVVRNIEKDNIEAVFSNGVLTITLPKADPIVISASHRIDIK